MNNFPMFDQMRRQQKVLIQRRKAARRRTTVTLVLVSFTVVGLITAAYIDNKVIAIIASCFMFPALFINSSGGVK